MTHLKWSDEVFWNATHRKIDEILKIDKDVNDPKKRRRNVPSAPVPKGAGMSSTPAHAKKITLEEALRRF